jgi:VWFA-related protein
MNLPRTARAALALIALGTVTPPVAGQPAPPADPVFADVFVADAAGRPVTGLRPGDIEVLEDGAPVPVVSCVGPTQVRGASSDEIARARQLVVALFVDDTATPAECQAVFAKADTVAGELLSGARSRVLVASGSGGVAVRQAFTADPGQVVHALEALQTGRGRDAGATGTQPDRGGAATTSVAALMESLGTLPGRKAFVYVGGDGPAPVAGSSSPERSELLRILAGKANAAGVTLYSIDASGGSRVPDQLDATRQGAKGLPGATISTAAAQLAVATAGGLAVTEGADAGAALVGVVRDFKSVWSVGFAPSSRGDGGLHRLRVRVKREGVTVRARSAFLDAKEDERMAERTLAALLLGFEDDSLGIQVSVTSEQKPKEATQLVTVLVTLPLGNLAFEARGVSHDCDITLWLAARDGEGQVIRAPKAKFPVSVPNDRLLTALSQTAGYAFRVPMKAGPGAVAVTVRDEIGMQTSTTVVPVAPATEPTPGVTP